MLVLIYSYTCQALHIFFGLLLFKCRSYLTLNPGTVGTSDIKEGIDNVWEATDKSLVKVSKLKKSLYIHFQNINTTSIWLGLPDFYILLYNNLLISE